MFVRLELLTDSVLRLRKIGGVRLANDAVVEYYGMTRRGGDRRIQSFVNAKCGISSDE